jgi:hypothetical protein
MDFLVIKCASCCECRFNLSHFPAAVKSQDLQASADFIFSDLFAFFIPQRYAGSIRALSTWKIAALS